MVDASVKSEYLSGLRSNDKAYIAKIGRWIDEGVAIFDSLGITEPQATDYERLRAEIADKPGKRGKTKSDGVIRDSVNAVKGYYDTKAGRHQMTITPETLEHDTDEHDNEPVSEAPTVDVQVAEAQKPKRGRKPKPENADRVQVSVYLPRETYEGVRDLAANSGQGISDILAQLAFFFTENNAEVLARIREVRRLSYRYELKAGSVGY